LTPETPRRAARVLLIDREERLLLLQFVSPDTGVAFWAPVGGGIDAGETAAEAAVREVAEETGLRAVELGPECFHREIRFTWRGVRVHQQERWFVARVDHFDVAADGWTAEEREDIRDVRWFTAHELSVVPEPLVPRDLASVFATLLADGPPEAPVMLGS
jgi:8-oxo-dGTP pyrophosphatase MutT (NUDIX family)